MEKFIFCFAKSLSKMYRDCIEHPIIEELLRSGEINEIKIAGFEEGKFQKDSFDMQIYDIVTLSDKRFEEICAKRRKEERKI